jgi:cell division protein FtsX
MSQALKKIPLTENIDQRSLPVIIGIMFFLLSFFSMLTFNLFNEPPPKKQVDELYVHIIPVFEPEIEQEEDPHSLEKLTQEKSLIDDKITLTYKRIISVLKGTPGVGHLHKVTFDDITRTLQQWHFEGPCSNFLEEVTIKVAVLKDGTFFIDPLVQKIKKIHPHTYFTYPPTENLEKTPSSINSILKAFNLLFIVLLGTCFIILISLTTRTSLKTHQDAMDTLRLMGAKKSYIYGAYQKQIFKNTALGALGGGFFSFIAMYLLKFLFEHFKIDVIRINILSALNLQVIIIIFIIFILLSIATTRRVISSVLNEKNKI